MRYRVYGITLATDVELSVRLLPAGDAEPDLAFQLSSEPPDDIDLERASRVYTEGRRADGRPRFEYWALPDRDVIRIAGAMDYHCWPDRIYCHFYAPGHEYLVDVTLFGMVLSLWLERRGTPTLHGAAAVVDGRGVVFVAAGGAGKTSTAAACVAAGLPMLSDDLVALEDRGGSIYAQPGYPQFRMWPAQARHFVGTEAGHQQIHPARAKLRIDVGEAFGRFHPDAVPLARIYVPERVVDGDAEVAILPTRPRHAMSALLRHSFLPVETTRFGVLVDRFRLLVHTVWQVPVRRLLVPEGLEQLPRVVDAIVADVRSDGD